MTQLRGKPCHSRQIKMAQVEYLLYNSSAADNQGGLRQGMPEVKPVDRTSLEVGSRNPPRRLRTDSSMRSVVGIPSLQVGEDVKNNSLRNTAALSLPSLVIARRRILEQGAAVLTAMALGVSLTGCAQNDALDPTWTVENVKCLFSCANSAKLGRRGTTPGAAPAAGCV